MREESHLEVQQEEGLEKKGFVHDDEDSKKIMRIGLSMEKIIGNFHGSFRPMERVESN